METATVTALVPRRCTATSKHSGDRCKRAPILGGNVCAMHGGKAPQVIAAAQQALVGARLSAAELLFEVIEVWRTTKCEACGQPKGDPTPAIRAAIAVLDRTGLGPSATLHIEKPTAAFVRWMPQHQLEQIDTWTREAKARMERGEREPEFIEATAVVVDEGVLVDEVEG